MTAAAELNVVDEVVLLLLRAKNHEPVPGRLFLQKEVFTLRREVPGLSDELRFDSHLLGPHSDVLESEAEQLGLSGFVDVSAGVYKLTARGSDLADEVARSAPVAVLRGIEQTKHLINDLSQDELLALVYFGTEAQEIEAESVEFKRIRSNRIPLALRLLKKDKVSPSRAAEIAGISVDELIERYDRIPA